MSEIDLQPFCGAEETRFYLMKPASRAGFTWATDGHLLVRVALRCDVPEVKFFPNAEKVFAAQFVDGAFVPAPELDLGVPEREICYTCRGSGKEHNCPDCSCECSDCAGLGFLEKELLVLVGAAKLNATHLRRLQQLPGLAFNIAAFTSDGSAPLSFRFDGGEGIVMSTRSEKHDAVLIPSP